MHARKRRMDKLRNRRNLRLRTLRVEPLEDRRLLATFTVINTADNGAGSLRQAVLDANGNAGADIVDFAAGLSGQTIGLSGAAIGITDDLTINGLGADVLTIDGMNNSSVFEIISTNNRTITLNDLHITRGRGGNAGGIHMLGSNNTLNINRSLFTLNHGQNGGALRVVSSGSTVTIRDSTFKDNTDESQGAALHLCCSSLTANIYNSTFSNNAAKGAGGAIFSNGSMTTIVNSTITNNRSDSDDGAFIKNTGTGNVSITGISLPGGDDCVDIFDSELVSLGGDLMLLGTTTGAGSSSVGVVLEFVLVESTSGRITIDGTSDGDDGVDIDDGSLVLNDQGDILIDGEGADDYLAGANGDDLLVGGPGNDRLLGGNEFVNGVLVELPTDGNDYLAGRGGDILIGGLNADRLRGGSGNDLLAAGTTERDNDAALLAILAA